MDQANLTPSKKRERKQTEGHYETAGKPQKDCQFRIHMNTSS